MNSVNENELELWQYPNTAGHQGGDTDKAAAREIERSGKADCLREKIVVLMRKYPHGMTADEAAHILGEDILSIRPRFTELKKRAVLFDAGKRRESSNGKKQRVLKLA